MYCPKCGTEMVRSGNELYCPVGNMGLAPALERQLQTLIESTPVQPSVLSADVQQSLRPWYCPRCRGQLVSQDPNRLDKICLQCGLVLGHQIIYRLIELHPHRDAIGRWC